MKNRFLLPLVVTLCFTTQLLAMPKNSNPLSDSRVRQAIAYAIDIADQKSANKGVLETHVKTKDKPVKQVFEQVLPELIELCGDLISNSISQDILSALQDALELAHKLPASK